MTLDAILDDLARSTSDFLGTLDDLSRTEWTWHPAPGAWSVSEIAEHTCTVQRGIERLFTTKMLEQPLTAESPPPRWKDDELIRMMADGGRKARAPEMVLPKGRWTTREELATAFTASTGALTAWVRAQQVDLRAYGSIHPMLGMMDGVQWLVFVAAHTRRHAGQVRGVRELYGKAAG